MLGKAKFNITIDMVNYKKGEVYEIKNQVTIDGLEYFEIVSKEKENAKPARNKDKEKETPVVLENQVVPVETETEKTEWENFDSLEK